LYSGGSGVGGAGGGEKRRGTLGKTPLRRVTPGPLFLWPIYRLLLLALCYYCYQVLFAPPLGVRHRHHHCAAAVALFA